MNIKIFDLLPFPLNEILRVFVPIVLGKTTAIVGQSIGVLGMPEAGKTQFYKTLKNEDYEQEATGVEDYSSFNFEMNGRMINVKAGKDIGGGEMYIQNYYEDFIKEKDVTVFIFDVKRYVEDSVYARKVRARLEFIWRKLMEKTEIMDYVKAFLEIRKKYILFASHGDQLTEKQKRNVKSYLDKSVQGKEYAEMFHNNMYIVDLRDREKLIELFDKTKLFI